MARALLWGGVGAENPGGRLFFMKRALLLIPMMAVMAYGQGPVPRDYFGMILHCCAINGTAKRYSAPWPPAQFGSLRLWDSETFWLNMNPAAGSYDWHTLDSWLDHAEQHHQNVMYVFGGIPQWASGNRGDPKCKSQVFAVQNQQGTCHPPGDLNEDASGSDQTFKDFAGALAKHANGRIKYWEVWNEPMNMWYWSGNPRQMVRITEDLRTIVKGVDPSAEIVSPGTGWVDEHPETGKFAWNPLRWTDEYLEAGGNKYIDVVTTHGYLHGNCPTGGWDLDQIAVRTAQVRKIMKKNGVADMPLWSTEGSWGPVTQGRATCTSDSDMQVAFVAQYHIAMWAAGYQRVYWYAWNDWDVGNMSSKENFQPTAAGKAYGYVIEWMVGATLKGCDKNKAQWKCTFTRPDGSQYLAIWDGAQPCANGNCATTPVKVDAEYVDYLDLSGGKTKIANNTVPVGLKPIWLEAPAGGAARK
jgi:polysaccharide biosynthesis protein PslG